MDERFGKFGVQDSTRQDLVHLVKPNGDKIQRKLRIAVCIPTRGQNCMGFTYDLAQMMLCTGIAAVHDGLMDIAMLLNTGTYIHTNREDLVLKAFEGNPTHLFWLDDDMRFPQDILIRLLKHNKPVVAANYTTRKMPCIPITIKRAFETRGKLAERLRTTPESTGLEEVEAIGFGAVLIEADVFRQIGKPWFEIYWDAKMDYWIGEDVDFCRKCAAKGIKILVDHDLSKEIGHVGEFEFRHEHAQAWDETFGGDNGRPRQEPVQSGTEGQQNEPLHQGRSGSGYSSPVGIRE